MNAFGRNVLSSNMLLLLWIVKKYTSKTVKPTFVLEAIHSGDS